MDDDDTRTDFPCWHNPAALCRRCESLLEWQRNKAGQINAKDRGRGWPEDVMKKLRLIQDQAIEVTKRETQRPDANLPPLSPFPDCDLCGEPGAITTEEQQTFCGACWRAHRIIQDGLRKFDRIEAKSLIPLEEK